jgi:hypothetical protein
MWRAQAALPDRAYGRQSEGKLKMCLRWGGCAYASALTMRDYCVPVQRACRLVLLLCKAKGNRV